LIIVDEATCELAMTVLDDRTGLSAYKSYFLRWASLRGHFVEFVTDVGGNFISKDFLREMQAAAVFKKVTAASSSESHGRVERVIRTVRYSLDRIVEERRRRKVEPPSKSEWNVIVASVENGVRNEVMAGASGSTASLRATGRCSSIHLGLLGDTASSGATETELSRLADEALDAYRYVNNNRRLRTILSEQSRPTPSPVCVGQAVEYLREPGKLGRSGGVRGRRWHGPAIVVATGDHVVTVDHGGVLCRVHPSDVRALGAGTQQHVDVSARALPSREEDVGKAEESLLENAEATIAQPPDQPLLLPKELPGASEPVAQTVGEQVHARPRGRAPRGKIWDCRRGEWADDVPAVGLLAEEGDQRGLCGDQRGLCGDQRGLCEHFDLASDSDDDDGALVAAWQRLQSRGPTTCLFGDESEQLPEPDLGTLDAYKYNWDDVSPEEKMAAFSKGFDDYDSTNSWERGTELPWNQLGGKVRLTTRCVQKAKIIDGKLCGRCRLTPRGFNQKNLSREDTEAPTANKITHRVANTIRRQRGWRRFVVDFSRAFFQSYPLSEEEVGQLWMELPEEDDAFVPGMRMCRKLLREVPGTKRAPQAWWKTLEDRLKSPAFGFEQSRIDPCFFWMPSLYDSEYPYTGFMDVHVDDVEGGCAEEHQEWIEAAFREEFEIGVFRWVDVGESVEFLGERQTELENATEIDQFQYRESKLHEMPIPKARAKAREAAADQSEQSEFRSALGGCSWVTGRTAVDMQYETSVLASATNRLQVKHMVKLNEAVRLLRDPKLQYCLRQPVLGKGKLKVVVIVDAGERTPDGVVAPAWQCGRLIGLMVEDSEGAPGWFSYVDHKSGKAKRVCHCSFDGETLAAIEGLDAALVVALLVEEAESGVRPGLRQRLDAKLEGYEHKPCTVPVELHTDSNSLITHVESCKLDAGLNKRRKIDIADIQELRRDGLLKRLVFIRGTMNPADSLTKERARSKATAEILVDLLRTGWYEPAIA